jgi:hypothetical protein
VFPVRYGLHLYVLSSKSAFRLHENAEIVSMPLIQPSRFHSPKLNLFAEKAIKSFFQISENFARRCLGNVLLNLSAARDTLGVPPYRSNYPRGSKLAWVRPYVCSKVSKTSSGRLSTVVPNLVEIYLQKQGNSVLKGLWTCRETD